MIKWLIIGVLLAAPVGLITLQHGIVSQNHAPGPMMLAQLTPEQAQCQQEAAQLQSQLAQCTTDACRQNIQAAIAAHNQRCG